jgi:hypothetical protein
VKTVMNVRVPCSSRNVWASRGSTSFSGRAVLCAVVLGRQHTVQNTRLRSRRFVKGLNLLPTPGFELQFLGHPARSLVTMLSGLTRLAVNTPYVILV